MLSYATYHAYQNPNAAYKRNQLPTVSCFQHVSLCH